MGGKTPQAPPKHKVNHVTCSRHSGCYVRFVGRIAPSRHRLYVSERLELTLMWGTGCAHKVVRARLWRIFSGLVEDMVELAYTYVIDEVLSSFLVILLHTGLRCTNSCVARDRRTSPGAASVQRSTILGPPLRQRSFVMAPKRHFRQLPQNEQITRLQARAAALQTKALHKRINKVLTESPQHVHPVARLLETLTGESMAGEGALPPLAAPAPASAASSTDASSVASALPALAALPAASPSLALTDGGMALIAEPDGDHEGSSFGGHRHETCEGWPLQTDPHSHANSSNNMTHTHTLVAR